MSESRWKQEDAPWDTYVFSEDDPTPIGMFLKAEHAEKAVKAINTYDAREALIRELVACLTMGAELCTPDFLEWIADRLVFMHGENRNVDYVLSLRERAKAMRAALTKARQVLDAE